jgi:DNA polymerase III delta subunit
VARKEKERALKKYNELRAAQVEAHYILVMLCWQMSNFLAVKAGETQSHKEVALQLGMNPYSVEKTRQLVKNISSKQLKAMSRRIIAVDITVKTTSIDIDQVLKQLIVEL